MNEEGSVGIVETQYFTFAEPPNEMQLDCGRTLGPITLAYETYGALNEDKTNAVLILHALSGDAHVAGYRTPTDPKPGWWDTMVGPGKAFDTDRYFVISSNVVGGCQGSTGPAAIDPSTGKPYGLTFPIVTIGDMVRAQCRLIDHLGIEKLLSVAGGSMGGMQALEWATQYPDRLSSAMVIASTPLLSPQGIAFDAVGRHAIQADPAFRKGNYYNEESPSQGLSIARMLAHITYLSDESMRAKFGRALRSTDKYSYDFGSEFAVETYLDYQGEQFVNRFDANTYLYITKAINYFDLAAAHGSLDNAMALVQCKMLVLSYSSDWLFPPYQSREMVGALQRQGKDVTYANIESKYGHDAFLLEVDVMREFVSGFLEYALPHQECCYPGCDGPPCGRKDGRSEEDGARAPSARQDSIYVGRRVDYDLIVDLIEPESRVLDVGCGDGELLCQLIGQRAVRGTGLELRQDLVSSCVRRGIAVIQANVDEGLSYFPDGSYEYAILSMTLQVLERPDVALREMMRVARKCIITFPNFGFWKVRTDLLLAGRAPVTRNLPYTWHTSPNRHVLSVKDFRAFCEHHGAHIEQEIPLSSRGTTWWANRWPNLFADEAVYVVTANHS